MFDILRKHHQAYTWRRCLKRLVTELPLEKHGWKKREKMIVPLWYTCPQFPKCLQKYDKSGYQADDEDLVVTIPPPLQIVASSSRNPTSYSEPAAKKFRRNLRNTQASRQLTEQSHIPCPDDYLADEESVLKSTESKNLSSISSDSEWERLSDFSGSTVSESSEDDSDWEL